MIIEQQDSKRLEVHHTGGSVIILLQGKNHITIDKATIRAFIDALTLRTA